MKTSTEKSSRLWGSAFEEKPAKAAIKFTAGRDVKALPAADYKLLPYDIWVNKAHCVMLCKQKIIGVKDAKTILIGLEKIETIAMAEKFILAPEKEDVHSNIESYLIDNYGIESAGKLHTARSRNDQVVTDTRLYLRDRILDLCKNLIDLNGILLKQTGRHTMTVMPGFTHRQHAMVTTFGHLLHAFATMLIRDVQKLKKTYVIINKSPLGNTASFGTSFPIDRLIVSNYLGFDEPDYNSLDAITNRGEPEADIAYNIVSVMNHLSILAETLIIMTSPEFDMLKLADEYSTGSSIMPQKKNPDTLEVIKGKASYAHGALMSLISTGKAAFLGYNRDSQWTKYIIMDLIDECLLAPTVVSGIIKTLRVNRQSMKKWATRGYLGATTLLEVMCATFHIPFRQGKIVIEKAIKYSTNPDIVEFSALKKALREESISIDIMESQVSKWQDPECILEHYLSSGSPGKVPLAKALKATICENKNHTLWYKQKLHEQKRARRELEGEIEKIIFQS